MDALALGADEGRDEHRYASRGAVSDFDPEISEWGNPPPVMEWYPYLNS